MIPIARRSRAASRRLAALLPLLAATLLVASARPARSLSLDFEPPVADLSDVAAASLPGVVLSSAQVLSEDSVALLLGYADAPGRWATSGAQGILNSLGPVVTFAFPVAVTSFAIDVLGLAKEGVTLPIALYGYVGDALVATAVSDPLRLGDSGLHEERLALGGAAFTRIELGALVDCGGAACFASEGATLFADSAAFTTVPEPGTLALFALGAAALARGGRR